ncbi:helix-turn-helix domain-containing protein [Chryseobacterium indologenes]|uniref:helix-turn-helix domain-containing protein n=1 Tax=Chryseobacterium indologenes TaxID=253 RepID=UPI000F50B2E2|nr:helix-turn-helix domain-containing protein [Chryseobacterium indologenes]AYZ34807.1 helix-turn-helix domain-containing protein [Chryseobacterium indologenes]MBF6643396.1 helix-turn-helix transcriptional regulator [Chryseobacterium indologenes]MBU3047097.1 AraC family transcriptional regulator [Chryseobacterium indologenes]MEB4762517.1 helix-turn-helix domain-containing protein [Chryseobacterium indologenes]QQQ72722.1 helix-turn-helix transcriptional regulator [Chryseobacterium indologenes]
MLYLSGVFLALFLAFLLMTKRNRNTADLILATWLAAIGLNLAGHYMLLTGQYIKYPSFIFLGFILPVLYGPFLYVYVKKQTSPEPFSWKYLLHFIPFLICNCMFLSFYAAPFEERVEIFKHKGSGFETEMLLRLYFIYISGVAYVILSFRTLYLFRNKMVQQFSNTEKINFNWLLYLILWITLIWGLVLFSNTDIIYGAVAVFILWLGYFGIKQVQVFNQPALVFLLTENEINTASEVEGKDFLPIEKKYQKSGLTEKSIEDIHVRLQKVLDEEKPFINPNLTLNELATLLEVHPNSLSQVINSVENKNFYELINQKRIEEFLQRISQPESKQYTLLSIALDCGFNSKTSFNRNFKKYTGVTPSEYQKV